MNTQSRGRRYIELFAAPFMMPLLVLYGLTDQRTVIQEDVQRWAAELERPECASLFGMLRLLISYPEFRSLFCHRLKCGNQPASLLSLGLRIVYRGQTALFLNCVDIGPGLFLQHAWSTSIGAERIGRNCWINQQVVIGYINRDGGPVIGDNVSIHVGAKVLGPIRIGNNVKIGANALVLKDVPDDTVVLGAPGISRPRKTIETPAGVS